MPMIVPESIRVEAFLVDTENEIDIVVPERKGAPTEGQPERIPVGPVFELNASTIRSWQSISGDRLPAASLRLPTPPNQHYRPFLFTSITTHGEHVLRTHDSSLTGIREIADIVEIADGREVQFYYQLGSDPRLVAVAPN